MSKSSTVTTFEKSFSCLFPEWCNERLGRMPQQMNKKRAAEAARRGRKCRGGGKGYSNFSVITGNVSLALARDLTTVASAFSAVVLRGVACSLTMRGFAGCSVFFFWKGGRLVW